MKSYLEFCIKQNADLIRNIVQFLKLVASCIKVYEEFYLLYMPYLEQTHQLGDKGNCRNVFGQQVVDQLEYEGNQFTQQVAEQIWIDIISIPKCCPRSGHLHKPVLKRFSSFIYIHRTYIQQLIAHQLISACTTGVGRVHISCYASAQQLLCGRKYRLSRLITLILPATSKGYSEDFLRKTDATMIVLTNNCDSTYKQ